jgi:hypothetical protein
VSCALRAALLLRWSAIFKVTFWCAYRVEKVAEYSIVVLNASSDKLLYSMSKETYYKGKRDLVQG